ncbi:hypothetical protein ACFU99_11550 [Streptomyces sp. NPDC057654]|uniref:hypothetical protein n=1 Tax=Streptomyces sp. NPDC057654 TaxID=3346196 RepID=UPI0036BA9DFC
MNIDLRQEAGTQYDRLGERLHDIAAETTPLVEKVTGLDITSPPRIRLITTPAWTAACEEYAIAVWNRDRGFFSHIYELPFFKELREEYAEYYVTQPSRWALQYAQCIEDSTGEPEILILTETLREGQAEYDDQLYRLMAHEITHLAQYWASDGKTLYYVRSSLPPQLNNESPLAFSSFVEGHAMWAQNRVTQTLLGRTIGWPAPGGTDRFREAVAPFQDDRQAQRDVCDYTQDFVEYLMQKLTLDQFNSLWRDAILFPTEEELQAPDQYLRRIAYTLDLPSLA